MSDSRKHILFVDEEPAVQRNVARILSIGASDLRLTCASDGAEALRVIERGRVDLLITSLVMPVIDGVELLRHLANRRMKLPVVVVTERSLPPEARPQAGCRVTYIREPIEREPLLRCVNEQLSARLDAASGGVTLVDLLNLLRLERRSCALRVSAGAEQGTLFFKAGALIDARHGEITGMSAALEILRWQAPAVVLDILVRARTPTVFATLGELLEACFAEDELHATQLGGNQGGRMERVDTVRIGSPGPGPAGPTATRPPFLSLVPAASSVDEPEVREAPDATPGPAPAHAEAVWEHPAVQAKIAGMVAAALEIEGATAAALASWEFDRSLGPPRGTERAHLEAVVAGHCRIMRAMAAMMARLGMSGPLRDMVITSEDGVVDILAPLRGDEGLFLWVEIDQRRGSMALAHHRAQKLVREFVAADGLHEVMYGR